MKPVDCAFETDALAAALQSRWPDRVPDDLRAHIEGCPACSDIVAIAAMIDRDREEMRACAPIPDSGRVWWLAQLRARREAAQAAARPITAAQVAAFAIAVGLLGACFGATSTWFQAALRSIASSVAGVDMKALLLAAGRLLGAHGAWAVAMALAVLLVPTAVYFALGRD